MSHFSILVDKKVISVSGVSEWSKWFETADRKIDLTILPSKTEISTVFLGVDHGFGGRPVWFETMVFGGPLDGEMTRAETYAEALVQHDCMVATVKKAERSNE